MRFLYFDLGNVLVTFDHRIAARNLASAAECSVDQVFRTLFQSDLQSRYETGLVSNDEYAQEINAVLGSHMSTEQVLRAVSDIFQPNWPIVDVLERVRAAGVSMGILSNTCDAHWNWLNRQNWPMLHGWFQHRILSYEIGCMKPDQSIYETCEKACGCSGSQIFFTDDRIENIEAAAGRGWVTHPFRGTDGLSAAIDRWLEHS